MRTPPLLSRLARELRRDHTAVEAEAALAALTVRAVDGVLVIGHDDGGDRLAFGPAVAEARYDVVRIDRGVYSRIPTSSGRVRLLEAARALADVVDVHVPIVTEGTYGARIAIDLPRRLARTLGLRVPEPGDRFDEGSFVHGFFDDEAVLAEARRAGLGFATRDGGWIRFERGGPEEEHPRSFLRELAEVARAIVEAERLRTNAPAEKAVRAMRARGARTYERGPIGRARLRRAIGWVDVAFRGGPNCFRRTLVEAALDAGAAKETIVFGLDVGRTGHVAFANAEERRFDVAFEIAAADTAPRPRRSRGDRDGLGPRNERAARERR